jgi:hypothetical protein
VYEPKPVTPAKPIDVRVLPPAPAIQVSDMHASALPAGDLPPAALPGDGTWSLTGGFTSRRLVDDEPQAGGGAEQFFFVGATYRWFDERQDIYYQADGFVRLHEHGDPALALHGVVSVRKPDWLVDLDVAGSLFLQHVDASGEVETAAALEARISRSLELGDKVSHRPSLAVFQRWLSLDGLPADAPETVDQDIYSRYKDDHGRGLRVGDRIQYRPWLDTVLFAGAHLVSNEDLDLTDPDHLLLEIGARQLIGDFDLGARYSHFQYYEDDDRERDSDTQRLWIDVGFSRWLSPYRGVEADLSYVYDSQSGDSSVFLSVSLNLGKGRYYEDYRPGDLDFRSIRQRRALERQASEERQ